MGGGINYGGWDGIIGGGGMNYGGGYELLKGGGDEL